MALKKPYTNRVVLVRSHRKRRKNKGGFDHHLIRKRKPRGRNRCSVAKAHAKDSGELIEMAVKSRVTKVSVRQVVRFTEVTGSTTKSF